MRYCNICTRREKDDVFFNSGSSFVEEQLNQPTSFQGAGRERRAGRAGADGVEGADPHLVVRVRAEPRQRRVRGAPPRRRQRVRAVVVCGERGERGERRVAPRHHVAEQLAVPRLLGRRLQINM